MTRIMTALALAAIFGVASPVLAHEGDHDEAMIGVPGNAASVDRTIKIEAYDTYKFKPSTVTVSGGRTVRFVIHNAGKLRHEFHLGTRAELLEHAKLMRKFPNMEHDDPNAVTVEPGKTATVTWKFTVPGTVYFGCLEPGHYEAGMKGKVVVFK